MIIFLLFFPKLRSVCFSILCAPTMQNMQMKQVTTICSTILLLICGSTLLQLLLNLPVMRWESTEFRPLFSLQSIFTAKQCSCFICGDSTRNITVSVLINPFTQNNSKNKNSLLCRLFFYCSFIQYLLKISFSSVLILSLKTPPNFSQIRIEAALFSFMLRRTFSIPFSLAISRPRRKLRFRNLFPILKLLPHNRCFRYR